MSLEEWSLLIAGVFAGIFLAACYYETFVLPNIQHKRPNYFGDRRNK